MTELTSIEICAGAGGQALGLEMAGFDHVALVENDKWACETLRVNRPTWNVHEGDVRSFSAAEYAGVALLAGGVPCPPFSVAGLRLGADDDRDLFPEALRLARECRPRAIMLENVRGLLDPAFKDYREDILRSLAALGYRAEWKLLNAADYGVPQLRPRAILVALDVTTWPHFEWPTPAEDPAPTVGDTLSALMAEDGWCGADAWKAQATTIAPTLVGGSKRHGGPDLGPTRAREAWARIGVDGRGIADAPPQKDFQGMPRLTVEMAARIQGFPETWRIQGRKTAAYRQVGNAFPPPVAYVVGCAIRRAIQLTDEYAREDACA